jgi:hypothetical protein
MGVRIGPRDMSGVAAAFLETSHSLVQVEESDSSATATGAGASTSRPVLCPPGASCRPPARLGTVAKRGVLVHAGSAFEPIAAVPRQPLAALVWVFD